MQNLEEKVANLEKKMYQPAPAWSRPAQTWSRPPAPTPGPLSCHLPLYAREDVVRMGRDLYGLPDMCLEFELANNLKGITKHSQQLRSVSSGFGWYEFTTSTKRY